MIEILIGYLVGGVATLIMLIVWSLVSDSEEAWECGDVVPGTVFFMSSWVGIIIISYLWIKEKKRA